MQAKQNPTPEPPDAFLERIPDNVLLEPIEYLFADHCRQADMCEVLKSFVVRHASTNPDVATAAKILHCLDVDMSMHIVDEEMDLFPRLRNRARPEDHFPELLRLLSKEHERDRVLSETVRAGLANIVQGKPLPNAEQFCRTATTLATGHLSHLNWENAVILPLARKRLTAEDLKAMGRTMASRRSIPYPEAPID
ncbi:MAG TPA: hemerythrin domain-containing protein [Magnetovibrio sp.]